VHIICHVEHNPSVFLLGSTGEKDKRNEFNFFFLAGLSSDRIKLCARSKCFFFLQDSSQSACANRRSEFEEVEIHDRVFRGPYSAVRRVGVCKVVKTLPPSMVLGVDEDEIACPAIQVQSM
jgi:hypothetical protein